MSSEFSKGDALTVGEGTSCLGGVGFATHCLVLAFLGAADTFGASFLLLAFLLILVTGAYLGASVTSRSGFWVREQVGPWQHDPLGARGSSHLRLSCSAWGRGRVGAFRTYREGAPLLTAAPQVPASQVPPKQPATPVNGGVVTPHSQPAGARLARAALASFHFPQSRYLVLWLPPQPQHLSSSLVVEHSPDR